MKSLMTLLLVVTSFNTLATTIKIECKEMDYPFVSRFNLTTELEVSSAFRSVGAMKFYNQSLNFNLTDRGIDGNQSQNIEVTSRGKVKYFAPGVLAKNEVIQIQSNATESQGYFVNLLLNYPTKNSSQIRTTDGKVYKSNCAIVSEKTCILGDSIHELKDSNKFTSKTIGDFFVQSRIYEGTIDAEYDLGFIPLVRKVEFTHKNSLRVFTAFYTFEDEYDGGNTIGWVENEFKEKVSSISDSDIYDCKAFR
jgi:hypothetical protein